MQVGYEKNCDIRRIFLFIWETIHNNATFAMQRQ